MKFSDKIVGLRKSRGMSQEDLADQLKVSRQAISRWESGITEPDLDTLAKISEILNCSVYELIHLPIPKQKPHWKKSILLAILLFIFFILHLRIYPQLEEYARQRYGQIPSAIYTYCLVPILYLLLGMTASSMIEHLIPGLSKKYFFLLAPFLIYYIFILLLFMDKIYGFTGYILVSLFIKSKVTPVLMIFEGFILNLLFKKIHRLSNNRR